MDNGRRRASKPLASPQKYRPGAPVKKKRGALADPLLLSPDVLDDATRRELLQEVMRPRRASPSALDRPSATPEASSSPPQPPQQQQHDKDHFADQLRARVRAGSQNSDDLVTAMAARLKDLEQKHRAHQSELQELHAKYRQLNDRYQRERQLREEAETAVLTLYEEKESLEQQLEGVEGSEREHATPRRDHRAGETDSKERRSPSPARKAEGREEKFDLFSGDFNEDANEQSGNVFTDGAVEFEKLAPTHFVNTARPGTILYSPQKSKGEGTGASASATASSTPARPPQQSQPQRDKAPRRHSCADVDVDLLKKNARILSDYVGWKGVVKHGKQAGIRERDVVRVVVYKNGICVNQGAFRPYGWALCDAFLDDLTEGYYPYEFKDRYPDGFPIEITDCSTETCDVDQNGAARLKLHAKGNGGGGAATGAASAAQRFPSEGGRRLGGAPLVAGQPRPIHTIQDSGKDGGYHAVSAAEFLSRVPAQRVTAGGQLVSVRSDVAALMGVKTSPESASNAPPQDGLSDSVKRAAAAEAASRRAKAASAAATATASTPQTSSQPRAEQLTKVKGASSPASKGKGRLGILIRLPDGHRVELYMAPEATVQTLRKELVMAAPQFANACFELCQAFPVKCTWDAHHRTLASFGIRKTCTLMVKVK